MKSTKLGLAAAGLVGVLAWVGACSYEQPKPNCPVGHGLWAVKYSLTSSTGTCTDLLKGEKVGFERYTVPGVLDGTVGIRPRTFARLTEEMDGTLYAPDTANKTYSLGNVPALPGADDFCDVTGLTPALQSYAAVPAESFPDGGGVLPLPAKTVRYEWSEMKILNVPLSPGTQMTANLARTEDGCTANYQAVGVWPAHDCLSEFDCEPLADIDAGRFVGSGINPSFPTVCDLELRPLPLDPPSPDNMGLCVLTKGPPALDR